MTKLLLASRNAKKLAELRRIVGATAQVLGLDDVAAFPELPETGATFEENATDKAMQAATATGLISLADDSGLSVDALNGMPGVLSARWSGRHGDDAGNNRLLLAQLADVPEERRGAVFICALALVVPGRPAVLARGEWRGQILRDAKGSNGFGYDCVFWPEENDDGRSSAELTAPEKDALSHRRRALRALHPELQRVLAG